MKIKILIADDSPTSRQLMRAIFEADGDFVVVAEALNGAEAVDLTDRKAPDIVVMDVHMPVMDGLEATKEIMARAPTPIVIVSAANNSRDVDLSLSATQAGALIALVKPDGPTSPRFEERCRELVAMAKAMAQVKVVRRWGAPAAPGFATPARRDGPAEARLVAIATSTGGPPALRTILNELPYNFAVPILIVQHIARDFAAGFADWLRGGTQLHVKLAERGETAMPGTVYVAPDDHHLGIRSDGTLLLSSQNAIGGFRPSADFLFESAGHAYGRGLVAAILTGMGADGARGLDIAHDAGAFVIAQDKASSVVYGMANEAVQRGSVDQVVPLTDIAKRLIALIGAA